MREDVVANAAPPPAVVPAAATVVVPAAPRCASVTEEAMFKELQELQRAEAAHYLAHQV
jgi:hypothetical protein